MKHDLKHNNMIDTKQLQEQLVSLMQQDVSQLADDQLSEHRRMLSGMTKVLSEAMAKTSKKEHSYDLDDMKEYIDLILSECWEGRTVSLGEWEEFSDAQKLRRFSTLIELCVKQSNFKEGFRRQFPMLSVQLSDIESAKTLQELRGAAKAMIGPLKLAREHRQYKSDYEQLYGNTVLLVEHDALIKKLEDTEELLAETKRVNAEILGLFEPSNKLEGMALLDAIEDFKIEQNCTDAEACKPFKVSRTTLHRLRKEFKERDK